MNSFPDIRFSGTLWPSQREVIEIAREQFQQRQSRIHIVAPPGSGKTVLGLYLWAECVKRPALVLSPNSAIQAQWTARTDLFEIPDQAQQDLRDLDLISMDGLRPALLTSLTYQSITMPDASDSRTDAAALNFWRQSLIEGTQAENPAQADIWIADLAERNPQYYKDRISVYRKKVREQVSLSGDALSLLHPNCHSILRRLREAECGLLILDECHHLMGHWGRVLSEVRDLLGSPIVIGLTATPPDRRGRKNVDVERYETFFGPIDYEIPVPAVVKDGFLAPYQDLALFVRPTSQELQFIANVDRDLRALVEQLCKERDRSAEVVEGQGGENELTQRHANPDLPVYAIPMEGDPLTEWEEVAVDETEVDSADVDSDPNESEIETDAEHVCDESLPKWLLRILSEFRLPTGTAKGWGAFEKRDSKFAGAAREFLMSRRIALPENVPSLPGFNSHVQQPGSQNQQVELSVLIPVLDRYIRHRLRRSRDSRDHALARRAIARLRVLGVQITETGSRGCASPVGRVLAYSRAKTNAITEILAAEHQVLGDAIRAVVIADFEKSSAVAVEVQHLLSDESGGAVAAFKALVNDERTDPLDPVLLTGSSVLVDDDLCDSFLREANAWLDLRGFSVELTDKKHGAFHVINGRGSDWSPRVYVELITSLFQQGLTKCLVGTRGLLGEGWDANKINVLIDLTTVTTSMTVNQLRGRSIRLDPEDPQKLANNWDVVCVAQEFARGLDDYKRFEARHQSLYGVTDDGAIEKGVGHVHAAFTELRPEGLEESVDAINRNMLDRVGMRDHFRSLWKVGQPYRSRPLRAVEVKMRMGAESGFPAFAKRDDAWTAEILATAIAQVVLGSLVDVGLLKREYELRDTQRDGGYLRMFIDGASEQESHLFGRALAEALGPIRQPRYVVERFEELRTETLISRFTPRFIGRRFVKRELKHVMLHSVPTELSRKRAIVNVFLRHWNRLVSPGAAHFVQNPKGAGVLNAAQFRGELARNLVREKDVFY